MRLWLAQVTFELRPSLSLPLHHHHHIFLPAPSFLGCEAAEVVPPSLVSASWIRSDTQHRLLLLVIPIASHLLLPLPHQHDDKSKAFSCISHLAAFSSSA